MNTLRSTRGRALDFTATQRSPVAGGNNNHGPLSATQLGTSLSQTIATMRQTMANSKLMDDLKAADMERRPYAEVLAQLSPRSRRKKRFETRCEINKRVWNKMAVRVQALIRGMVIRKRFNIVKMLHQRRLDNSVKVRVEEIRNMMENSENYTPFQVIQAVDEVLSINPKSHEMLLTKARVQVHRGDFDDALETTAQLLDHPTISDTEARRLRFCIYMQQGDFDRALGELECILEKEGQVPRYAHLRAMMLGTKGRFAEALDQIEVAIERGGEGSEAMLRRGLLKGCLQQWDGAMVDMKHSIAFRETAKARHYLGRLYLCKRRWKDAMREVKKALVVDPGYSLAQNCMAEIKKPYDPLPIEAGGGDASDAADDPYGVARLACGQPLTVKDEKEEKHGSHELERNLKRKEEGSESKPAEGKPPVSDGDQPAVGVKVEGESVSDAPAKVDGSMTLQDG